MNQEGMDDRYYFSDWPGGDCGDPDCISCYPDSQEDDDEEDGE